MFYTATPATAHTYLLPAHASSRLRMPAHRTHLVLPACTLEFCLPLLYRCGFSPPFLGSRNRWFRFAHYLPPEFNFFHDAVVYCCAVTCLPFCLPFLPAIIYCWFATAPPWINHHCYVWDNLRRLSTPGAFIYVHAPLLLPPIFLYLYTHLPRLSTVSYTLLHTLPPPHAHSSCPDTTTGLPCITHHHHLSPCPTCLPGYTPTTTLCACTVSTTCLCHPI